MSLGIYKRKRHFEKTPEPEGKPRPGRGQLRFVVQKHHATRLHYDFRLELDGVLKSWAVPKGPSLNPKDKRLAVMVEDHPLDYRTFEGVIPEGNYGAGSVIVWDRGTYHAPDAKTRQGTESAMHAGLAKGHLHFSLDGRKLKGEFDLVRLKQGGGKNWLLIKRTDAFGTEDDVTAQDRSVVTKKSLAELSDDPRLPERIRRAAKKQTRLDLGGAPNGTKPRWIKPMFATLVNKPFDRPGWLFEIKYDGFRAIADVGKAGVRLYSRNQILFNDRFPPLVRELKELGHEAILDGEAVVVDEEGKPQFQLLQNYQKTGQGQLAYFVFDLLHLDGHDLRDLPLTQRKELLKQILSGFKAVRFGDHVESQGIAFYEAVAKQGLEGIVAKNGASCYREGQRGHEWLKIKTQQRQEAVIGGFTEPRGSRKNLGALVLGVYQDGELVYIGNAGGGFDTESLDDVHAKLQSRIQKRCPFRTPPKTTMPVQWVKPDLVCEVTFQEWTGDGRMRQPIFLGLREDKEAKTVRREKPRPLSDELSKSNGKAQRGKRSTLESPTRNDPPSPALSQVSLTNLDKIYWPDESLTKGDLINYYREIGPVIVPYLKDRPLSLNRHPNGIQGKSFFQKDVSRQPPPPWVETVSLASEAREEPLTYALCQNQASLLYLANLGCIEMNPWNSRVRSLDRPDYLIIDLDPEAIDFAAVVEAAQEVHKLLDKAGAECHCKTSGKSGLHIFVPLGARYEDEVARQFAEVVAQLVNHRLPETTSIVRSPAQRQGRVYLDYLQNKRGATLACAYSVRPAPGATVSAPLKWPEITKRLDPTRFTMATMPKRLDKVGDLWQPVLGRGVDLAKVLERLK